MQQSILDQHLQIKVFARFFELTIIHAQLLVDKFPSVETDDEAKGCQEQTHGVQRDGTLRLIGRIHEVGCLAWRRRYHPDSLGGSSRHDQYDEDWLGIINASDNLGCETHHTTKSHALQKEKERADQRSIMNGEADMQKNGH